MSSNTNIDVEKHPLEPFLPESAKLLMLGSFPPQKKRWSIDFYYPNLQNDMWRIFGIVFFSNKNHFVDTDEKRFKKDEITSFLNEKGIALYDTAYAVRRLKDNASDNFLEIVEPANIEKLLSSLPYCNAIATTGGKAIETISRMFSAQEPKIGEYTTFRLQEKEMKLYRMPSSSRAYPLAIDKKAAFYEKMLIDTKII